MMCFSTYFIDWDNAVGRTLVGQYKLHFYWVPRTN